MNPWRAYEKTNTMKTKALSVIAILLISGLAFQGCKQAPETKASSDKYRLVWTDDPTATITVAWNQIQADTNPVVMYGTKDHGRKFWKYEGSKTADRVLDKYDMHTHFAKLTGLTPGTAYYFVIKDDAGVSDRYWFRTAPDKPEPFTFVAGGDTKSSGKPLDAGRATNRIVSKLRPLFVLYAGDFCSGNGTDAGRWHLWLDDWQKYVTTSDGRMIPIVPVHGNHENGDQANLNYIFNAPYQQNDSSKIYYSLSFGGDFFHVITLNSSVGVNGEQRDWLENDLKKHRDFTFKIAAYHKPIWPHTTSKGEHPEEYNAWAQLFYDYGLDISIDGDTHLSKITYPLRPDSTAADSYMGYVRDDEKGTIFMGEGSWGAHPRPNDDDKPWTIKSASLNQIKWVHVMPEEGDLPDRLSIYTVISATYGEKDTLTVYDQEVEALTEVNLMDIPANINLLDYGEYGKVIRYPFILNEIESKVGEESFYGDGSGK